MTHPPEEIQKRQIIKGNSKSNLIIVNERKLLEKITN
jgi:hypothetical protein